MAIIKIMKTNFLKNINEIPKQFLFDPKIINADNLKIKKPKYFIVLGMGGSALAGDLLKNCLSNPKLIIHKNYGLPLIPEEVLKNSLIIAISYSGNTEEVIDGYNQAKKKKLAIAVISTGGKLLIKAKKDKMPYVDVEIPDYNLQPRLALGLMMKALAVFVDDKKIINEFVSLSSNLNPKKFQKIGEKLAKEIFGYIPIIYASEKNKSLAYQWKISFNENTKIPAFFNTFPELNHNEMSGFDNSLKSKKLSQNFYFIFLQDKSDDLRLQKRMKILQNIFQEKKLKIQKIELNKTSNLEKIFSSILLANFTSYYLAEKYLVDPEDLFLIENYKKIIAKN